MKESDLVNVPGCTDFETYHFCTVFSTLNSKTQQYESKLCLVQYMENTQNR